MLHFISINHHDLHQRNNRMPRSKENSLSEHPYQQGSYSLKGRAKSDELLYEV